MGQCKQHIFEDVFHKGSNAYEAYADYILRESVCVYTKFITNPI